MSKPLILIPCNTIEYQKAQTYAVKHQYVRPLIDLIDCVPLLLPVVGDKVDIKSLLRRVEGILLTGSTSNVTPALYGASCHFDERDLDTARDDTVLPLIRAAIDIDKPLFAICRGFQEMNVALGGSLHQFVQQLPGKLDHRENNDQTLAEWYLPDKHTVHVQPGGLFQRMGLPEKFQVNSLHQQGIDRLGDGLFVEGVAEDGLIEAISLPALRFMMGVQWHPECSFDKNPADRTLFEMFGAAVREGGAA